MRKLIVAAILFLAIMNLQAQPMYQSNSPEVTALSRIKEPAAKPLTAPASDGDFLYRKGTLVFNAGVSVGLIGYGNYGYGTGTGFLPVTLSGEYSLNNMIGVSAYFGFYGKSYDYVGENLKYNVVTFGGRLVFHATELINEKLKARLPERLDLYATLILGYRNYSWSGSNGAVLPNNTGNVTFGPALGARYMLIKNLGAYVELGRGPFGVLGTGLSLKF